MTRKKDKKKKKKKCFLLAGRLERFEIQKVLNTKYDLVYTDNLHEAQLFVAEKEFLMSDEENKKMFERAERLGILSKVISFNNLSFDLTEDFLELDQEREIEKGFQEEQGLFDGLM